MSLIHHIVQGDGHPPLVFVHGFACALSDWDAQVAHLLPRHRTVAVDLRGHGATPATPAECSIERYGADVAELLHALDLPPAVLVGHSMGCRVVTEAALQAPSRTAAVVFLDGSQFAPALAATLKQIFATPGGFTTITERWFAEMFTAKSDPAAAASVVDRARRMPPEIGQQVMLDMQRYDVTRFATSFGDLRVPVMAIQSTYTNEKRERRPLTQGQTTPFLDMLRARIPAIRTEVIADTGHFAHIDQPAQVNALLDSFLAALHPAV